MPAFTKILRPAVRATSLAARPAVRRVAGVRIATQ